MRLRLRQVAVPVKIGLAVIVFACVALLYGVVFKMLLDQDNPDVGRAAWGWCIAIQYILVCLIAPAITANCITQEKEQQTWEMLVFSRLQPSEIIFGKLLARLAVIFLLLALFMPVTVFSWIHSAVLDIHSAAYVTFGQFLLAYAVIIISAVFFATFGLFMSWQVKKTLFAIMLSYTFVIGFLLIGTAIVGAALQTRFSESSFIVKFPLMWLNPGYLLFYAAAPDTSANSNLFVIYGLLCYVVGILLMLWRMILGFRRFSYDDDEGGLSGAAQEGIALVVMNLVAIPFGWLIYKRGGREITRENRPMD